MIRDRVAFDLPAYDGLLAGHYLRGQGYARRRPGGTDDWLLVMTLSGEGRFGSDLGDLAAKPPSLFLLAPGTTHDYGTARSADSWEILWVHFHPPTEWLDLLGWPLAAPGVHTLDPRDPWEIESALREVCRLSVSTVPRRRRFAMNALERALLLCEGDLPGRRDALDGRVRLAVEHIHHRLSEPLTCERLAEVANLSVSRFSHLFREQTGMSPRQYVLLQRLERARLLLESTALGVAEVASEVGIASFYLSNRFRAAYGQSPSEFRRGLRRGS